jgi:hypothetical protein
MVTNQFKKAPIYIRFTIDKKDSDSHKQMGIFHAIRELKDKNELLQHEIIQMDNVMEWFAKNLEKPGKFNRSKRRHAQDKAISWYKDTAMDHLNKMHEIKGVLNLHGINVNILKTEKPGYIVYEDNFQVCAEPFTDTKA